MQACAGKGAEYAPNAACAWEVAAPAGAWVGVEITRMEIEPPPPSY